MLVALGFGLSLCTAASAQDVTGSINGTVRDSSGSVVSGATVTIINPQQNDAVVRTLTTNESGEFSAPSLQSGVYQITAEAANFKKAVQTDIKVDVGQRRSVDLSLEAGNISETVTVQADAVAVNLSTPTAGTTINGDQVRELSINNRNFVQLLTLSPGVSGNLSDQVYVGTTNPDGQANTVSISVNGARSSQNTFTVDGADITDRGSNLTIQAYPSVDSIGEFKVLRSLYPAESGKSGGGQVNIVTRSGTDKFHGSLFEFVKNEKFNASTFINNRTFPLGRDANGNAIRPPFRYNNYGFTIGGPIYSLKFGERDPSDELCRQNSAHLFLLFGRTAQRPPFSGIKFDRAGRESAKRHFPGGYLFSRNDCQHVIAHLSKYSSGGNIRCLRAQQSTLFHRHIWVFTVSCRCRTARISTYFSRRATRSIFVRKF